MGFEGFRVAGCMGMSLGAFCGLGFVTTSSEPMRRKLSNPPPPFPAGLVFRGSGLGFRVWGLGFRVSGFGFKFRV